MKRRMLGHHHRPAPGAVRSRRERGAVLVEAAFIGPIIFFMLFGIIEGGNLLYANLAVDEMAGHGDRTASIVLDASDADFKILQKMKAEKGAANTAYVDRVVIYKASSRGAAPNSPCQNSPSASAWGDSCVVYFAADFNKTSAQLTCDSSSWCSSKRKSGDLIGVWIRYKQPSTTGIFGTKTLTSQQVAVIEAAP